MIKTSIWLEKLPLFNRPRERHHLQRPAWRLILDAAVLRSQHPNVPQIPLHRLLFLFQKNLHLRQTVEGASYGVVRVAQCGKVLEADVPSQERRDKEFRMRLWPLKVYVLQMDVFSKSTAGEAPILFYNLRSTTRDALDFCFCFCLLRSLYTLQPELNLKEEF